MAYLVQYGYVEVKEVENTDEANAALGDGWDLISTYTKRGGSLAPEDYILVYVLGKKRE
jgi:hypothetical protein